MRAISFHPYLYVTAMASTYDKSFLAEFRKHHSSAVHIKTNAIKEKKICSPRIGNIIETVGCLKGLFMLKSTSESKYILLIFKNKSD